MSQASKVILSLLLIAIFSLPSSAQSVKRRKTATGNPRSEKTPTSEQQRALLLLDQLFETAKDFEDGRFKIRVQAQIADALWGWDEPRARSQFNDTFRAIDSIKLPGNSRLSLDAIRWQLRAEILRLIAKRDPSLAEKLNESSISDTSNVENSGGLAFGESVTHQMQLAMSLADSDPKRAVQIVKRCLESGINSMFMTALQAIRMKDSALADDLFAYALAAADRDDANLTTNVRMLASYLFPDYSLRAGSDFRLDRDASPLAQTNPAIAARMLGLAFKAVVRDSSSHAPLDYLTAQQLLPFFDHYMPDRAEVIRNQLHKIRLNISADEEQDWLAGSNPATAVEELLSQAEATGDIRQKDAIYQSAAAQALSDQDFDLALSIAGRIDDKSRRSYFDSQARFQAAIAAIKKKEFDAAYRYGKDIPDAGQRASALSLLARALMDAKNIAGAMEMIDDAERLTRTSDEGLSKARAMLTLTDAAARFDPIRGFEMMKSAVEAINRCDPADKRQVSEGLWLKSFDFNQSFSLLARADFDRAVLIAQTMKKEASLLAQLALCRSMLTETRASHDAEEKSAASSSRKTSRLPE